MIISQNPVPTLDVFQNLMHDTDLRLNNFARGNSKYFVGRNGTPLEDDVLCALTKAAINTPFEGTIIKVSGASFPDIVACGYYGVEVKSTKSNSWKSTGSSILESTRVDNVERIYLTFGKLGGNPVEFLSKPYEQCLYDIAVTHMPRYLIDMQLDQGKTIFDKMGIPYDDLREMDNPVPPVAEYYRKRLKPGETLWWTSDPVEEPVSAKIRLWRTLSTEEKLLYKIYALVNYPEVFCGNYDAYSLWLTSQGVVDAHLRDQFSAGGKEYLPLSSGKLYPFPGVFRRVKENSGSIIHRMTFKNPRELYGVPEVPMEQVNSNLRKWIHTVSIYISKNSAELYRLSVDALNTLFWGPR